MEKNNKSIIKLDVILLGVFLAIGISISGYFIGQTLYNAKMAINTAEAKGLATRKVVSDKAIWSIGFQVADQNKDMVQELYKKAEQNQQEIIALLKKRGFTEEEISKGAISYNHSVFRDEQNKISDEQHVFSGDIEIETNKVYLVKKSLGATNELIAKGINVENRAPTYIFTKLNEIKPAMLEEATKNARIAADQFAKNAAVKVLSIRSARQGGFSITDDGENYGDRRKINKEVRVVTNIEFLLSN